MSGWIINDETFERPAGQRGAVFIYDGQMWDTAEHDLFCTSLTVGSPEVRQNKREALALDGFIDLTEQFGRPVFGNRTISWRFLVTEEAWEERCAEVRDLIADLHGRNVDILVDDYEGWTFTGRLALERVTHQLDGTYIDVTADCDPFRRDGSTYYLPSDPTTFSLGPAQHVTIDAGASAFLRNPSSYTMLLARQGGASNVAVFASNAYMNIGWDDQLHLNQGLTYETATCPASETVSEELYQAFLANMDLDVYVYAEAPNPSGVPLAYTSKLEMRMKHASGNGNYVRIDNLAAPAKLYEWRPSSPTTLKFTYDIKVTYSATNKKASWSVKWWFCAVPAGATAPTVAEVKAAWTKIMCIETFDGPSGTASPTSITKAAPYEVFAAFPDVQVSMSSIDTLVYDLSDYGHRFYTLKSTLPTVTDPSDPYYIDIDGRRYYADESPYSIEVNAGYRSRVSVYGSGISVMAEGLAI